MPFPTTLTSISVEYFTFCGRSQPIHLFLEDAGIPYTVVAAADKEFQAKKSDYDLYPFNQVPIVVVNGTTRIAQQDAILRFFGKVLEGYAPPTLEEETTVDMLACSLEDFNQAYSEAVWSENHATDLVKFVKETVPRFFGQYEHLLTKSKGEEGTFVSSLNPSFPEFTLYHLVSCVLVLRPSSLSSFPLLSKWYHERMSNRKGIKAYLESGRKPGRLNYLGTAESKVCD